MSKFSLLLATMILISGCSLFSKRSDQPVVVSPETQKIEALEKQMKAQNFEGVVAASDEFQKAYPYSTKLQRARFLKARALEELQRWSEAVQVYQTIAAFSEKNQPEISAMSIYRLSYVYEALGDDQRVITSLFEAAKYHKYLPMEVIQAEIPSRLAMVYAKENNPKEAQKWLAHADQGLKKTLESRQEPLTDAWLAEMYYNMGSISTQQLSRDNILTIIQGQQAVQKYLIRSMQYGDPVWSAKALKRLKETYMDLWKAIENSPEPSGYEPLVAQRMKKEEQQLLAAPFSALTAEALLYRPGPEQKSNSYQTEFFNFLEEMQTRVRTVLETAIYTPLMPGRDKSPQKAKTPGKLLPSADPNL